jgi:predicted RNA polymerase sigma factor
VLGAISPSPIVDLNRAVALAMAFGPAAGLDVIEAIKDAPALAGYPFLPSVRGDLLQKLGRSDEARAELERAARLTQSAQERAMLLARARACGRDS